MATIAARNRRTTRLFQVSLKTTRGTRTTQVSAPTNEDAEELAISILSPRLFGAVVLDATAIEIG